MGVLLFIYLEKGSSVGRGDKAGDMNLLGHLERQQQKECRWVIGTGGNACEAFNSDRIFLQV